MNKWHFLLLFVFIFDQGYAQFRLAPKFDVPVSTEFNNLERAWEGGMNSPQFQTLDLNQDEQPDLVVYHRISRDITTYLFLEGRYQRSPEFDHVFPSETRSLFLLKDFDCDGKKDLFTSTSLGIKVYKNTSNGESISWSLASNFLTFGNGSNIQLAPSDIPGIADVNGDGSLDILTFRFGNANSIDLYLNTGACGNLTFERTERRWGDFEECGCNNFVFGESCPIPSSINDEFSDQGITHIGGKTILVFDADNDGDMDLITSDETCETLLFLENEGDLNEARMTDTKNFPLINPAGFPFFPSAFMEDIDQDGLDDLLIATNADENTGNLIELSQHIKVYANVGTEVQPIYETSQPFLQNEMIDLGEHTYPSFVDYDLDGDQDLFVGNKGLLKNDMLTASIHVFENIGNPISPSFQLINSDFLDLSALGYTFIKPQFIDIDNDQDQDLIYQRTLSFSQVNIILRENLGDFEFGPEQIMNIGSTTNDNPYFYDLDQDGDLDILLGKQFGSLSLFINQGDLNFGPEINSFAGIEEDFDRLNLNVHISDLDDDGKDDLITTDLSGEIRVFRGPIDLDFLATNPISDILLTGSQLQKSAFGIQSAVSSAYLLGPSKPSLILGNTKGGLVYLENLSENNNPQDELIIRVRPNPSIDEIKVLTNVNGVLEIFSSSGQLQTKKYQIVNGQEESINISHWASGIYILKVITEDNKSISTKLIVQ